MRTALLLLPLTLSAGCLNLLNPEAGMAAPKDPGSVAVKVLDQAGVPVASVKVSVEMPSNAGNLYTVSVWTHTDGTARIAGVPAGRRRVLIALPPGFTAGDSGLVQEVDVVKNGTVSVEFVLVSGAPD